MPLGTPIKGASKTRTYIHIIRVDMIMTYDSYQFHGPRPTCPSPSPSSIQIHIIIYQSSTYKDARGESSHCTTRIVVRKAPGTFITHRNAMFYNISGQQRTRLADRLRFRL